MLSFMIGCYSLFNSTINELMEVDFFLYFFVLLIFMVSIAVGRMAARTFRKV